MVAARLTFFLDQYAIDQYYTVATTFVFVSDQCAKIGRVGYNFSSMCSSLISERGVENVN
jgi:hypothetical protein